MLSTTRKTRAFTTTDDTRKDDTMKKAIHITGTRAQWEGLLNHMQNVSDPYCMRSWLAGVLERNQSETLTLPAYGCGADFISMHMPKEG